MQTIERYLMSDAVRIWKNAIITVKISLFAALADAVALMMI